MIFHRNLSPDIRCQIANIVPCKATAQREFSRTGASLACADIPTRRHRHPLSYSATKKWGIFLKIDLIPLLWISSLSLYSRSNAVCPRSPARENAVQPIAGMCNAHYGAHKSSIFRDFIWWLFFDNSTFPFVYSFSGHKRRHSRAHVAAVHDLAPCNRTRNTRGLHLYERNALPWKNDSRPLSKAHVLPIFDLFLIISASL